MANADPTTLAAQLRRMAAAGSAAGGLPDAELVRRFVEREADELFIIEVAKKTWEKSAWRPMGDGFDSEVDPAGLREGINFVPPAAKVRHNGKVIGESSGVWLSTPQRPRVVVTEGHIAVVEHVERPGKPSLPAVRVWTAATGKWETLDGWADSVVGWVK